jgi:hypothetical protein
VREFRRATADSPRIVPRGLELTGHFRDGDAHRAWRLPVPRRSRTGMDFAQ